MGTGGALGLVRERAAQRNLILNGDSYAEAVYTDLLIAHAARGPEGNEGVTLLAVRHEDAAEYGGLELDGTGRVTSFEEKGRAGSAWINAGVYVAGRRVIRDLPHGPCSLEREILPMLAERNRLWAVSQRFFFRDIGTPERLAAAQEEFRWIRARFESHDASWPWVARAAVRPGTARRTPSGGRGSRSANARGT